MHIEVHIPGEPVHECNTLYEAQEILDAKGYKGTYENPVIVKQVEGEVLKCPSDCKYENNGDGIGPCVHSNWPSKDGNVHKCTGPDCPLARIAELEAALEPLREPSCLDCIRGCELGFEGREECLHRTADRVLRKGN